jgi:PKD repeat protein
LFIDVETIGTSFPAVVVFSPLTNGDIESIEWDFGDGTTQKVDN